MSTIPKGSLILVTGVNGYIASHTANRLLKEGYLVRGTVRAKDKADWLYGLFDKLYGEDMSIWSISTFQFAILTDRGR